MYEGSIENTIKVCISKSTNDSNLLRNNELRLNNIVNSKYLISNVENIYRSSITIPSTEELIRELISYSVGCMFGRYSLEKKAY